MPAVTGYWTGSEKDTTIERSAESERSAIRQWHTEAWKWYSGDHPKPLKVAFNRPDNNVLINLVGMHVDHTISFAAPSFPQVVVFPASEKVTQLVDALWNAQGRDIC